MKKLYLLMAAAGIAGMAHGAEPTLQPEPSKSYMIQHTSGMVLTREKNSLTINLPGSSELQYFTITPVADAEGDNVYNLKLNDDTYLGSDSGYTVKFLTNPEDAYTQFSFWESGEEGYIKMWNLGRQGYLGTDNNNIGGGVYTDKSGLDGKHCWRFIENDGTVITTILEGVIANAEAAVDGIIVGNNPGNYPQESVDTFMAILANAKAALNSGTQEEVNQATFDLNDAISALKGSQIIFNPQAGQLYYFVNIESSLVMGITGNKAVMETPTAAATQMFEIIPVENTTAAYNFKISDGSGYLTRSGGWNTVVGTDPDKKEAKHELVIYDLENSVFYIKKFQEGGYLAADSNTPGSTLFTNKGAQSNATWQIRLYTPGELLTFGIDAAIATAEKLVATAVVGEDAWQYPQEAVDALNAAIEVARNANPTTQDEVNEVSAALNAAIDTFRAAVILPTFKPVEGATYRYSIRKYETKYLTNNDGSAKTTSSFASGAMGQHWSFVPVEGAKDTYVLTNGGMALGYDGAMTAAGADAPQWKVIYNSTISNIDYFTIVEAENPGKVMTFSSGNTMVIQDYSATNNAHQGRILSTDMPHDPNRAALEQAIANARNTLQTADRGNAIGQYSDAKCEAFAAVIAQAENLSGATQEETDAMVTTLNTARTEFINNPNSVIKDALEALMVEAREKAAAAVIGVEPGQYYESEIINFNKTLDEYQTRIDAVVEQEECDALTDEFRAVVEAFSGHAEAVNPKLVLDDAITIAKEIYDANRDNVGDEYGQRPQEVIDAFAAAIAAAEALTDPNINDIKALLDAQEAFLNGSVSVNRTAIRNAIAAAEADEFLNLRAGDFDGCYPQDKIDAFTQALANAKAAEADKSSSQSLLDQLTGLLNQAMGDLRSSKVTINFADLDKAITYAKERVAGVTVIGDEEGACPQSEINTINAAIAQAEAIDRTAVNQTSVDEETATLDRATELFYQAVLSATGVNAAIQEGIDLLMEAQVGFRPGQYPQSAIDALQNAIEAAKAVAENMEATQAELINAAKSVRDAMTVFEGQVIPEHDLTEMIALIKEADDFIAETNNTDYTLKVALDKAKQIVTTPNDYTGSEVKTAQTNLRKALDFAKANSGINGITLGGVCVEFRGTEMVVKNLPAGARVMVYALDGRLMADLEGNDAEMSVTLQAAAYVVAVANGADSFTKKVVVK